MAFTAALLAYAREHFCVDDRRVFAFGFSWGGWMANQAGCALPQEFTAIASIAGGGPGYPATGGVSGCRGPVPALIVHGKNDGAEPIGEARKSRRTWTLLNGCQDSAQPYGPSACVRHACTSGADLVYCEWEGGHAWPEWTSTALWDFFRQQ